jgi:FixJ family two-component response regulator
VEQRPTVFIVGDDASVRETIRGVVRSIGVQAEVFDSPQVFLRHGPPSGPGCLVLDVRLPEVSGLNFQQELSPSRIHIPIIFLTGFGGACSAESAGCWRSRSSGARRRAARDVVAGGRAGADDSHRSTDCR